jgi:hypothetical protein
MASENNCPPQLWTKAINTTNYLINRSSSWSNHGLTLDHVYLGKPLKLDHLKVFGCIAYVHTEKSKRNKMELKSFQCMFIGYDDRSRILMFQSFDKKDNS